MGEVTSDRDLLATLIGKATDSDLADGGRYFSDTNNDLCKCGHGDTGEYQNPNDGKLIEWLWNNRNRIFNFLESIQITSTFRTDTEVQPEKTMHQHLDDADRALEAEQKHSDLLAEHLRLMQRYVPDHELACIAIDRTNISIGDVVDGILARHDAIKAARDE
jgi:hypothetical protein